MRICVVNAVHIWLLGWLGVVAQTARANGVLDWNRLALDAVRDSNSAPTLSTRNLAILNLAMWESFNAVDRSCQPYHFLLEPPADTSPEAALMGAGHQAIRLLYPSYSARADALLAAWMEATPATGARADGVAFGAEVAGRMHDLRAGDGAATQVPYIPSEAPGQWRRTPPFFRPPLDPHWRYVTPFALREIEPFVVPPPPGLASPAYAEDYAEVRRIGAYDSAVRTEEQSLIAIFWSDFSYTAMPPGHWYEIAIGILSDHGEGLARSVRLMALLSLAQADAAIVCWEGKYRYNAWRPLTAIQRGDEDGNPATVPDAAWDSWLISPNFPEYPSGHSTFSRAAAEIIAGFYGTDALSFTATSDSVPGVRRHYESLLGCADEVGLSRIYGGIHFQFANREGKRSGALVAREVLRNQLLPLDRLPFVRWERMDGDGALVRVHVAAGHEFVLEATGDLKAWREIGRGMGQPGGTRWRDEDAGLPGARFYRAVELP
ncbi:MAG: phosphatase PAP2 family protein [Verrucomicrobiae bacterium]|nr:phosphatase PAP2 family protein [Verrucomicrobiae bacterium]